MIKHINLLPSRKQTELYYEDLYHSTSVAVVIGVVVLLLGVAFQIFVMFYLQTKGNNLAAEIATSKQQTDKTENADQKQQIKLINSQMQDFEKLANDSPQWSKVLLAFGSLVPKSIKISNFEADAVTGKVKIIGFSPTRDAVIELYNNISADKDHFKDIDYPLENVSKPTDILFNYSFTIQDGVLIPKP